MEKYFSRGIRLLAFSAAQENRENNISRDRNIAPIRLIAHTQHGFCVAVLQGYFRCAMLAHWKPSGEAWIPRRLFLGANRVLKIHT